MSSLTRSYRVHYLSSSSTTMQGSLKIPRSWWMTNFCHVIPNLLIVLWLKFRNSNLTDVAIRESIIEGMNDWAVGVGASARAFSHDCDSHFVPHTSQVTCDVWSSLTHSSIQFDRLPEQSNSLLDPHR